MESREVSQELEDKLAMVGGDSSYTVDVGERDEWEVRPLSIDEGSSPMGDSSTS